MKSSILFAACAVLVLSTSAFADIKVNNVSASECPLGTMTPMNFSDSTMIYNRRMAVMQGEESAIRVLKGQAADDQFAAAVEGAEAINNTRYETTIDAAMAIVDLAESLRN